MKCRKLRHKKYFIIGVFMHTTVFLLMRYVRIANITISVTCDVGSTRDSWFWLRDTRKDKERIQRHRPLLYILWCGFSETFFYIKWHHYDVGFFQIRMAECLMPLTLIMSMHIETVGVGKLHQLHCDRENEYQLSEMMLKSVSLICMLALYVYVS